MNETTISLYPEMFQRERRRLIQNALFECSVFRYSTGVCAVEIKNNKGSIIALPFQGQQIWRAAFCGHELTMKSIFDEPEATTEFGLNYGGFLIHCGLTANGNPSDGETYPLHGELPNAPYQTAFIKIGQDGTRPYIALGGSYTYRNSLEYHYRFEPEIRLYHQESIADVFVTATNLRKNPMQYMYMAHINWIPIDGAHLEYSARRDKEHIEVYDDTFDLPVGESGRYKSYIEQLKRDPTIADSIDFETQCYDPELCMYILYEADNEGFAHAMQVLPNEDAFYVGFHTKTLPNAVRWFARTGDEDAIGFAIPSFTNHLGLEYNKQHGHIREIASESSVKFVYKYGYVSKDEKKIITAKIREALSNPKQSFSENNNG